MSPLELMLLVIRENTPNSIWTNAPLESFRRVANTNRGDIGEEFVRRYLEAFGIVADRVGSRISAADLKIGGKLFEVKTASEDKGGSFQFNHVRLDRTYDYLFCLGVPPSSILFDAWRKGAVSEGSAGTLVRMAEGQSVTFKLTKKPATMKTIEELPGWMLSEVLKPETEAD